MVKTQWTMDGINSLQRIAAELLAACGDRKVFAFYGNLGAGKTTMIQSLCRHLNALVVASSPTFTIINEYETENGDQLYHFDLYRIKNLQEAVDIGVEEYLYSGNYCFIEWPQVIEPLLPDDVVVVDITMDQTSEQRHLNLSFE